jgi:hypothetical protein
MGGTLKQLTIERSISALKNTYRSLDVRAIFLKCEVGWVCIFSIIRASMEDISYIESLHKEKATKISIPTVEGVLILLESITVSSLSHLINEIEQGFITLRGIRATIINSSPTNLHRAVLKRENVYALSNFEIPLAHIASMDDDHSSPIKLMEAADYIAEDFGLDDLNDLKPLMDVDSLRYPISLVLVLPIYCKANVPYYDARDRKLIVKGTIHTELLSNSKVKVEHRRPPDDLLSRYYIEEFDKSEKLENGMVGS